MLCFVLTNSVRFNLLCVWKKKKKININKRDPVSAHPPTQLVCGVISPLKDNNRCGRGMRQATGASKLTRCLTSTETTRLIRDGEMGAGGMEVGEEADYIPIAPLSPQA